MRSKKVNKSTRFPVDATLNTQLLRFAEDVNAILEEDSEQAHIQAAESFIQLTPVLLPDEYYKLRDAWSDLNVNIDVKTMDRFDAVVEEISYRALNGEYPF